MERITFFELFFKESPEHLFFKKKIFWKFLWGKARAHGKFNSYHSKSETVFTAPARQVGNHRQATEDEIVKYV